MSKLLSMSMVALPVAGVATSAHAYIGPGAGIGLIGSALILLGVMGLGLFGVVFVPLRRMKRRRISADRRDGPDGLDAS